jgi:hypothetical protein
VDECKPLAAVNAGEEEREAKFQARRANKVDQARGG